jgi:23S rRNA (adenine2503-C2)-methyltransferase
MKEKLFGKTLTELAAVAAGLGMPRHAAGQLATWLYKKGVRDIASMSDISAANRARLAEAYDLGLTPPLRETVSADGTKKYLFAATGSKKPTSSEVVTPSSDFHENLVESAMIPDHGRERNDDTARATLCLSSQAGCRMACAFCATGRQGLQGNLSAGDILNQFASLPERDSLTNIVYMGMGEPLDNLDEVLRSLEILTAPWGYAWSPTRITLSTAGVGPALERFLAESRVHLAVSLHNPFGDERAQIMPIERAYPISKIVDTIRRHPFEAQRRVSFEYIVMSGLNDSPRHVAGLVKLLGELSCRVNLIRFHKVPGSPFFSPPAAEIERMRDALTRRGIRTTIRASRGEDIEAACGLLSTNSLSL